MSLDIQLFTITRRSSARDPEGILCADYIKRIERYAVCSLRNFPSEQAMLDHLSRSSSRTTPFLMMADSRGRQVTSEEFAAAISKVRDQGTQLLIVAIGPADGWSASASERANLLIAFGRITLPHRLASVIAAEQVYRAFTLLAGHPYHTGH
jgi:23S rRNA (pseudouridine1915-N3)-methyltransferase